MAHQDLTVEDWQKTWRDGDIGFHSSDINPNLLKHQDLLGIDDCQKHVVFVPLCGKSVDIKWFYERSEACRVIGCELSEIACDAFFHEQEIPCARSTTDQGLLVYKSNDGRITIYCTDVFKLSKEVLGTSVDVIWDRGALVAVNVTDQRRYCSLMVSLMSPQCRCLLEAFHYDTSIQCERDLPNSIAESTLKELYGPSCKVEFLSERWAQSDPALTQFELPAHVRQTVHLVTRQ